MLLFHQHDYNFVSRRVHITQATLDYLGGEYEVEAGMGGTRNQYLRDHCVTTYFIVPPARRRKVFVYICMLLLWIIVCANVLVGIRNMKMPPKKLINEGDLISIQNVIVFLSEKYFFVQSDLLH